MYRSLWHLGDVTIGEKNSRWDIKQINEHNVTLMGYYGANVDKVGGDSNTMG